ncbi:MAG: bile acid:sodium symporter [Phycisphaerales bacterium]|nr:bile acid:sodium symporter [Phycisphaerales bacterium]
MKKTGKKLMDKVHWVRSNGFVLALLGAVVLAFLLPGAGAKGGVLQAGTVNNFGIALILFLQGVSLAFEKVKAGAGNWRLHLLVQVFTYAIFPLVGLAYYFLFPWVWPGQPAAIRDGFLYLCVLPSTVSTSVVLTAVARGNTAGALFNSTVSNLMGVFLTPVLVQLLMHSTGEGVEIVPLLKKILLLTLFPFFVGVVVRTWVREWVDARKRWVTRISNTVIVFFVYSAFCDSVQERVWQSHGLAMTAMVLLFVVVLFVVMSGLSGLAVRVLRFCREDSIAAYFCSVQKTLAMGMPLGMLIFGGRVGSELSLILLPLMFYHLVQLVVNGVLANRWGGVAASKHAV